MSVIVFNVNCSYERQTVHLTLDLLQEFSTFVNRQGVWGIVQLHAKLFQGTEHYFWIILGFKTQRFCRFFASNLIRWTSRLHDFMPSWSGHSQSLYQCLDTTLTLDWFGGSCAKDLWSKLLDHQDDWTVIEYSLSHTHISAITPLCNINNNWMQPLVHWTDL